MRQVQSIDLLIIGGGINGVGIARDAAGRGLTVRLVEQGDLAQHTSSASTKLIHGGLRYLEYLEFRLVRESLIERERLLRIAPHIIRPLEFVIPCTDGLRSKWLIRAGLFLYDHIGGRKILPASREVNLQQSAYGSGLKPSMVDGFLYADCVVDDSRLVLLNAVDARDRGAEIGTRTRLVEARRQQGLWRAVVENTDSGTRDVVESRILINASGPWVSDLFQDTVNLVSAKRIRLVKGSHIVIPRVYDGQHALMLQNPDRRIVFAIPYEEKFTLIGTTDVAWNGPPGRSEITREETRYLCDSVNRYLSRAVRPHEVIWSYSGVRPLVDDAAAAASAVTRDYVLDIHAPHGVSPLLSVFGGKITTYRKLAEHALQKLRRWGVPEKTWTHGTALPGGDIAVDEFDARMDGFRRQHAYLPAGLAQRLFRAYGTRADRSIAHSRRLADLGEHFGGGLYQAEVDYLVHTEWARTAEDILYRRSKLGLHLPSETLARLGAYLRTLPLLKPHADARSAEILSTSTGTMHTETRRNQAKL